MNAVLIPKDLVSAGEYGVRILQVLCPTGESGDPPTLTTEQIAEALGDECPHSDLERKLKELYDLAMVEDMGKAGYTITKYGIEMVEAAKTLTFPETEWPYPLCSSSA